MQGARRCTNAEAQVGTRIADYVNSQSLQSKMLALADYYLYGQVCIPDITSPSFATRRPYWIGTYLAMYASARSCDHVTQGGSLAEVIKATFNIDIDATIQQVYSTQAQLLQVCPRPEIFLRLNVFRTRQQIGT